MEVGRQGEGEVMGQSPRGYLGETTVLAAFGQVPAGSSWCSQSEHSEDVLVKDFIRRGCRKTMSAASSTSELPRSEGPQGRESYWNPETRELPDSFGTSVQLSETSGLPGPC